jgi:hypothetical protein
MSKRKTVTMLVRVSVPVDMTAAEARREVRTLINDQSNYMADPDGVRVKSCAASPTDA